MSTDDNPFPGPGQDVSTDLGPSVEDAVTDNYNSQERAVDGIAEGDRVAIGQHLKYHADAAGVSVVDGLDALIAPAVVLRHGSQQEKRQLLGDVIDDYNVQPVPVVQSEAIDYGGADGQPGVIEGEAGAAADAAVVQFISANPVAQDPQIQSDMTIIVNDMWQQGYRPGVGPALERALEIAIERDPRFSAQAQAARQTDEVSRARSASGQVSGSGSSAANQASDDLGDIIGSLTPNW